MFRAGAPNPYDEIVNKTTDENLTAENWELILNLCDKVNDEGEPGARNVIAAVLKRLAHRNPNVQLYALALAEALSKNCRIELHRELASRSFTQGLERLITDRTTHEKVRRKALGLIATWTSEFEKDSTLGIMEECYNSLKAKNYSFEQPDEAPPPQVDDEIRRREEEELQRVLEMSLHDKGGRSDYGAYGAGSSAAASNSASSQVPVASSSLTRSDTSQSSQNIGYTEAQSVSPTAHNYGGAQSPVSSTSIQQSGIVTRVRALHTFQPTDKGELAFEKGDIIKVVDRNYKDWWRGQLKGRTGIFPVNYVEALPEPTPSEIAREAEQEALIFSQAANIDKLLSMLRGMDPTKDNLADNEDIQELYRQSMALRPKIVKLIDKYSQKRAELVSMNESFVKARNIFDHMMEDSLARHSGIYDRRPSYTQSQPRPNITPHPDYRASSYGTYDHPTYSAFPQANVAYPPTTESIYAAATPQPFVNQQLAYQRPYSTQPNQSAYSPPGQLPTVQQQPHMQGHAQSQVNGVSPTMPVQSQPQDQAPVPNRQQQQQQGPPYIFDSQATYADPNVQAWAQYYVQGGKDRSGAVYFVSVPGVTDEQGPPVPIQQQTSTSQYPGTAPYQSYPNGAPAAVNSSNSSLPTQADPMSVTPSVQTQAQVSQQMIPQSGSPTLQHRQSYPQQGVHEGPVHPQVVPTESQAYPPNSYQTEQPAEYFQPGAQPPSTAMQDPGQFPNQFAQMPSQFDGMSLGEQLSPSGHGVPAAQAA